MVAEPALKGRQEEPLLELLQETLARDPEQMEALHLLVRVYSWQRDDERLRTALERLADAAETSGAAEEERKALSQLARLSPDETRYGARLQALGGPLPDDDAAPLGARSDEIPTFESFMLNDDAFAAPPTASAPPETLDASSSFADLNSFTDALETTRDSSSGAQGASATASTSGGFQEIDFGVASSPQGEAAQDDSRFEQMLVQELESVDFYLEQGYTDIARDTLEMLERQYGEHAEIRKRRALLPADAPTDAHAPITDAAPPPVFVSPETFEASELSTDESDFAAFDFTGEALADAGGAPVVVDGFAAAADFTPRASATPEAAAPAGIDPGLAAIFDEFREAVEDSEEPAGVDFETHFNMGIAYREMGMLDQSIQELQTAIEQTAPGDGTTRYLQCCNLLGHCFMEKEMPRPASTWFSKGLNAPGHTEDEYQALRFELGTAYERMGDTRRASKSLGSLRRGRFLSRRRRQAARPASASCRQS